MVVSSVNCVNGVNNYSSNINFRGETNLIKEKQKKIENETSYGDRKLSIKKTSGLAIASALAAAALAGAAMHGHMSGTMRRMERSFNDALNNARRPLENEISNLRENITNLQGQVRTKTQESENLTSQLNNVTQENNRLASQNSTLRREIEEARDRFNGLLDGGVDEGAKYQKIKGELEAKSLDYDVMEPPVTGLKTNDTNMSSVSKYDLLPRVKTGNRADMTEYFIPEVSSDGRFNFRLPTSDEVRITNVESVDFATVWGQAHTTAERVGTSTENFINWVNESLK